MPVSVIIPSRGTAAGLTAAVTSTLAAVDLLDDESSELIVVLNGPAADRAVLDVDHDRLRVIREPRAGAAHARNIGMSLAGNPMALFTDDDCIVPASWCRDHSSVLGHVPATAAPVHVPHHGPITRYLDYKRIFAAPPLDTHTCRYFVTANCGINRTLLPWTPHFDDTQFNNAAEDAALGYQIVERGGVIQWLSDVPPVVHALREHPDELLERSLRYGVGNAKIVDAHARWQESCPYTDDWLLSILKEEWHDYRRFPEFTSSAPRQLFTDFNIIEAVAWLAGYLGQTQRTLGTEAFVIDHAQLESDLSEFLQALLDRTSVPDAETTWEPRISAITRPVPETQDDYPQIAALLRRSIIPTGDENASQYLRVHLRTYQKRVDQEQNRIKQASIRAWTSLPHEEDGVTLSDLEIALRTNGVTVADGLSEVEKVGMDLGNGIFHEI
jgi:glycosyltransferase involved in cell wall biosynthesis